MKSYQERNILCTTVSRAAPSDEQDYARQTRNKVATAERRTVARAKRNNLYEAIFNYDLFVQYADGTKASIGEMNTEYINVKQESVLERHSSCAAVMET